MTSEMTPLPWRVDHDPWNDNSVIITEAPHARIAIMTDHEQARANAAFIVTACNAHASLVEALREARDYMLARGSDIDMAPTIDKVERALASIEPKVKP